MDRRLEDPAGIRLKESLLPSGSLPAGRPRGAPCESQLGECQFNANLSPLLPAFAKRHHRRAALTIGETWPALSRGPSCPAGRDIDSRCGPPLRQEQDPAARTIYDTRPPARRTMARRDGGP